MDTLTIASLFLLSLQFGLQPLLTSNFVPREFPKTLLVLTTEIVKIVLASVLVGTRWGEARREFGVRKSLMRAGIPAALFSLQNWLILYANQRMSGLTLSLLNQTKTLSTAFFAWIILGKVQSARQLVALIGLLCGGTLVVYATEKTHVVDRRVALDDDLYGILAVSLASLLSGLSSALTERALSANAVVTNGGEAAQRDRRRTLVSLVYSMELAMLGILTLLASVLSGINTEDPFSELVRMRETPGRSARVLLPAFTSAGGGILVGIVTQRAGGVRKGIALIAGICLTFVAEYFMGIKALEWEHVVALILVCGSIWLHASSSLPIIIISHRGKVTPDEGDNQTQKREEKRKKTD